jgi:hypothetical protein
MTQTTDFDRLVTSWLEGAGATNVRDDLVEAALGAAHRTPRRGRFQALLFGPAPWPVRGRLGLAGLPSGFRIAIVVGLLALLATGAIVVGSRLLQRTPPAPVRVEAVRIYDGRTTGLDIRIVANSIAGPIALPDGRALGFDDTRILVWDGASNEVQSGGTLRARRDDPTAVVLDDGRVLIIGGDFTPPDAQSDGTIEPATAELWDPQTLTSSGPIPLAGSRWLFSAIRLPDGRVLVTGGLATAGMTGNSTDELLATAEIFDPSSGAFTPTGSMTAPRLGHTMALLPDGRVAVVGGALGMAYETQTSTTEIYDPTTGAFSPGDPLDEITPNADDSRVPLLGRSPVVSLTGDEVLVPGLRCQELHDIRPDGTSDGARQTPIELYDPKTGRFSPAGTMPHCVQQALPLPNGELYVRGWWYETEFVAQSWAGIYDPRVGNVREVEAPTVNGLPYVDAVVLADGRVVFVGTGMAVID